MIRNRPLSLEGHPFPTLYWLTCPEAVRAVSGLESEGWIRRLKERADADPGLGATIARAHEEYARERGDLRPGAEAWGGVGGTEEGLKCLHAHYAYWLAGGNDPIGAWVGARVGPARLHHGMAARRVAAIDLGTNSIRLLVAAVQREGGDPRELARDMVITRIGEGVDATGRLLARALERTLAVLARYCRRAAALGATRIRLAATSAVRDASNRGELAAAAERMTGQPMEVLSGEEEGALSFLGATAGLELPAPLLVMDIGGGSTEFVLGEERPSHVFSADIGSVRLTERLVRQDPLSSDDLASLDEAIEEALAEVEQHIPVKGARTLVAVGGTATTVQGIAMGLPEYDPARLHRSVLRAEDSARVGRSLAALTREERRALPVMAPGREDVIPAGAAILSAAMRRWRFAEALVSETDILDGLVLRMVEAGERG